MEVFTAEDWFAVARLVSNPSIIEDHPRLLRSLNFVDDDYGWNVQDVLSALDDADPANIDAIVSYLEGVAGEYGGSSLGERVLREGESVRFRCDRDLVFVRELGRGGTGQTMLFRDETAGLLFAIKKFVPSAGNDPQDCYRRFVQEAVILLRLSHPNVVRVYNYYLYPQAATGYIQMEYVDGVPIDQFRPTGVVQAAQIFSDAVSAFEAIERAGVLHRDVRPSNILVTPDGDVKLIDFGFGKAYSGKTTLEKNSILLNWPASEPDELAVGRYDRATEVYYVGRLFKATLDKWGIRAADFPYTRVIEVMAQKGSTDRYRTFSEVRVAMLPPEIGPGLFDERQLAVSRAFFDAVSGPLAEIHSSSVPVTIASD